MSWSRSNQPVDNGSPIVASRPGAGQAPYRRLGLVSGQVRGIGGDEIKALAGYWHEEVATASVHADTVQNRVESGGQDRAARDINGDDACAGLPGAHRDDATAGAHIKHAHMSVCGSPHRVG